MLTLSLVPAMIGRRDDGMLGEVMPDDGRSDGSGSDGSGSDGGRPDFALRIIQARERAGMTQKQLADKLRRSQQTIAGWEAGKREPDVATYKEVAAATNVDLVWLILGRDPDYGNTISALLAKAQEQSRYFAWAFKQAADFLAEEGLDADFTYVFAYT